MKERFPSIDHWMIGRGLIADPFLPNMIKQDTTTYPENRWEVFGKYHDTLFADFEESLSGPKHLLMKMTSLWDYFSSSFNNPPKVYKRIKKAKSIQAYDEAVRINLLEG